MQMSDFTQILSLQNNRLFSLKTPLSGQSQLLVNDFAYHEELSRVYTIELGLTSQDSTIELKELIAKDLTVDLSMQDGTTRYFHGYVTRFVHLGTDGGLSTYSATLRPWLWMLGRRYDIRIFQEKTSEAILREVFSQYGAIAKFEFRVRRTLKPYSYCTQYRESDLNFFKRLLEQDGLFFYFEHDEQGHTLIITDDSVVAKPIDGNPVLRYATGEMFDEENVVTQFRADRKLESGRVSLKTADYKAPAARRYVSGDTLTNQGDVEKYEIYDYLGAHGFDSTDRGEELMRFRLEALEAEGKVFIGASNCRTLTAGRTFQLTGHYDHDSGQDEEREFLVIAVSHHGTNNFQSAQGSATYSNSFVCIRKKIPFRPSLTTPKPMIAGPQTAIVVGPKGEEIYTDELGRVKVQFHWDRLGQMDHRSSCWVRVGQAWAGSGFGAVQVPRVGDEVVVSFLDGNPDRPLIISRVYNQQNPPPWKLPENATQSGILSRSTTGSYSTANAIRFEDKKGAEELWLQAEKDMNVVVEDAQTTQVLGGDRTITVEKGDQKTTVSAGNLVDTVTQGDTNQKTPAGTHTIETKELWIKVGGDDGTKIHMTGDAIEIYKGASKITIDGSQIKVQASNTHINPDNKP
ncbi:type VI secretion system tip protein VgrG [Paraburkholderia sp. B3]|uniref:type VI secretion system Vgr family protein n=1 Tax=Paraburkholderia sp. B3 TaxID=3134791 RepID=UPI003982A59A